VSENRRIQAKKSHFSAFSVDGSVELLVVKRVKEYFRERIEKNSIFAGFDQQELVGLIGFYRHSGPKDKHKGVVWGMYVKPRLRGSGFASALLNSIIELAQTQVEQIQLTVVTSNQRAIRFYEASGFRGYGIEKNALKCGQTYFDELHMVLFLPLIQSSQHSKNLLQD
jgi:ribosomal protein S18 acetylase RimI-like enzyme